MSVNLLTPGTTPQRRSQLSYRSPVLFEFRPSDLYLSLTDDGAGGDLTKFVAGSGQTGYFARNSVGLFVGRNGIVSSAFTNFPAFNYDLANDEVGLLLQAARTNLVTSLDISSWTDSGTPTVTAVTGPGPSLTGYSISDNDGAASELKMRTVTYTTDAAKAVAVAVKYVSGTQSAIVVRDTSAGANRLLATITWSGTNPGTPAMTTGTFLGKFQLEEDWWLLLFQTSSVTAANTNQIWLYGTAADASQQGATSWAAPGTWDATIPPMLQTASLAQGADSLYFDAKYAPQAMTRYTRFIERGSLLVSGATLWHLGLTDATTDPRLRVTTNGSVYLLSHDNGSADVSSTLAAGPAVGQLCELRQELYTDGSVQIHQSLGEAAETSASASAANALGSTWGGSANARNYINSDPAGGNVGNIDLLADGIVPGTGHTMAQLRARFS